MVNITGDAKSESGAAIGVGIDSFTVQTAGERAGDGGDDDRSTVFISHSSRDAVLADAIVRLVQDACGLAPKQLFSSSSDGYGVPPGRNFGEYIRETLRETQVVVYLMSPAFLASKWCLVEMGATWAAGKQVTCLPVLIPPTTPDDLTDLGGVMREIEAISLDRIDAMLELVGAIDMALPGSSMDLNMAVRARDHAWVAIEPIVIAH